jgi:hypothetical protein
MQASTAAPGLWRRIWNILQAVEMSSGEHQDRRIERLERRVAALEQRLSERSAISIQRA